MVRPLSSGSLSRHSTGSYLLGIGLVDWPARLNAALGGKPVAQHICTCQPPRPRLLKHVKFHLSFAACLQLYLVPYSDLCEQSGGRSHLYAVRL
jgi:hypothetical protein